MLRRRNRTARHSPDVELAAALKQAAIDQHALAGAFDQMARTGDVAIRAVK